MEDQLLIFGGAYLVWLIPGAGFVFFITQSRSAQKRMMAFGALALLLAFLASRLASRLYYNPRPFMENDAASLIPHASDNGFPSDHTLLAAVIATMVYPFSKKLSAALWLATALVGISRVLAGVHHGLDVLGSIAIAAGTGFFAYHVAKKFSFW